MPDTKHQILERRMLDCVPVLQGFKLVVKRQSTDINAGESEEEDLKHGWLPPFLSVKPENKKSFISLGVKKALKNKKYLFL
jgi:hypothetical protein